MTRLKTAMDSHLWPYHYHARGHDGQPFKWLMADHAPIVPKNMHYLPDVRPRFHALNPQQTNWGRRRHARIRLCVAKHHIPCWYADDIFPGQVCIGLETGERVEGIHIVRYWDAETGRRIEDVAGVSFGGRDPDTNRPGYYLYWNDERERLWLERSEVAFAAEVISAGCSSENPAMHMYSN